MSAPPKIEICELCARTPAATGGGDLIWWCCHRGDLVTQSVETGASWGVSGVTADECRQFLANRDAFFDAKSLADD